MAIVPPSVPRAPVAIIGIGCRFPGGANDPDSYWQNLLSGKDCITPTPRSRYDVASLGSADRGKPGRLVGGRGGYIDGFDEFDPAFFGISPREAEHMDPQQRKVLEVAWEALEDGAQKPAELAGTGVGVFVGAFTLDYKILQFADLGFETLAAHTATGTMMTMVSNRISYCLDLRGPSVSIDTACSSSLVAVHLACESLARGESSLALAGGTLLHLTPQYTIAETKGGFLSPGGRSRTFDAAADGYVRAEGVAIVALKLLADAQRDGDPVHAVIIGSGANQDGRTNGITVPNPDAQVDLVTGVCAGAGITPGDLQYVEAHGTSTPVGDPLEAEALGRALAVGRDPGRRCYVASVKANIGHTESAAGIAGLIKSALCLEHRTIPPHINLDTVNPAIDLAAMPFEIPREVTAWPDHDGPARAGVNAFGFGGTNAHVLLEEAPPRPAPRPATDRPVTTVLPVTARHPGALGEMAAAIRARLAGGADLADVGHTLAHRRQHHDVRLAVAYSTPGSLDEALAACAAGEAHPRAVTGQVLDPDRRRLAWVFTGMGPQWWAMGRQLHAREPVYREAVERCDELIRPLAGWSLVDELHRPEAESRMAETWLAQPANFALQVGLAALWRSRGVEPDAVVGHSTGEVAAFHEAGVYTLEDAVTVVVHRSRLQQTLVGTGTMLAVSLTEEEAVRRVRPYGDRVSVAAVNSPTGITLAGEAEALAEIAARLESEQLFARFLSVRVPYHSPRMEQIREELLASLADLRPRAARLPLYLTGRPGALARGPELDAAYWWENVRNPVAFAAAVERLVADGHGIFLEVGPHPVLARSIGECLEAAGVEGRTVPSIRREEDEPDQVARSLAELHTHGVDLDWDRLQPAGRATALPPYPWRRDRYWVEPQPVADVRLGHVDHPLLGRPVAAAQPTWEAKLDVEKLPYLQDHRIQGSALFPAAGYVEMAAQAARALTGDAAAVGDLDLRKALFLPDGEVRTVQLTVSSEDARFTIATVAGDGERTVHATGTLRAAPRRSSGGPLDCAGVQDRCRRRLGHDDCYEALQGLGYDYGPAFQGIEEVWIGPGEALARIRLPAGLAGGGDHHAHPVLLDACFQALLTPLVNSGSAGTSVRLPVSVGDVSLDPLGDGPVWAHATVTAGEGGDLIGDIAVHAGDGTALGRVSAFRAADIETAAAAVGRATIDGWLTELAWVEIADADADGAPTGAEDEAEAGGDSGEAGTGSTAGGPVTGGDAVPAGGPRADGGAPEVDGPWLVLADDGGIGDELAALLAARGTPCHLARRRGAGPRAGAGAGAEIVDPGSVEDLTRLLDDRRTAHGGPFRTIVHLWNLDLPALDATGRDDLGAHGTTGAYSLVALARAMLVTGDSCDLHVVTRGTQAVTPDDEVEPLGAPAWGIGRVLRDQELVASRGALVDLDPRRGPGAGDRRADAEAILGEVTGDGEREIALRGDRRYTSRLRPAADLAGPLPLSLRPDGSYLVTGAFGALGRLVCRTLVRRGARRLVLVGRRGVPPRPEWSDLGADTPAGRDVALLRELEAQGAHVSALALDITDEAALRAWLDERRRQHQPPIRGVFHLAGQVHDTLVAEMDRATFDAAYDPKVVGAHLLHRHLADEPLEHFVLFASVASLLTTAGQTNYAAGNAFLDALAHHRRARGLPALSLDWGPWATGMIEELGLVDHYRSSRGMASLAPAAGMAVLERVMGQDKAQLLVATVVDWPVFLAWYPTPPPLVAELAATGTPATGESDSFLDGLRAADDGTRRSLLAERLRSIAASVLRTGTDDIDPAASLNRSGLDSLLAMEIRARVLREIGIALPVVALLGSDPSSRSSIASTGACRTCSPAGATTTAPPSRCTGTSTATRSPRTRRRCGSSSSSTPTGSPTTSAAPSRCTWRWSPRP